MALNVTRADVGILPNGKSVVWLEYHLIKEKVQKMQHTVPDDLQL
jgi:hypothetical protein